MSALPTELAATVQAAHINRHPDPLKDLAPATAADKREPVTLHDVRPDGSLGRSHAFDDSIDEEDEDDIPYSVLRPAKPKQSLPPLPDLRFEQSYLHSIAGADTWWKVMLITARDQVMMPLAQGVLYNVVLCGWQHWNRTARMSGDSAGARLRRWWYGVNNWKIPPQKKRL